MRTETDTRERLYSISEAAENLGLSVHTLRKYELNGLVLPQRSEGKQRRYSSEDIDRLRCIHKAVNEEKVSIEGIRRMLSMVPCWAMIDCPQNDRKVCPAYLGSSGACWELKHQDTISASIECRLCSVYTESGSCDSLKELLKTTLGQ